jgi:hypothetical protein
MRAPTYEIVQDVLITSASRSGTWLVMQAVQTCGRRRWLRIGLSSPAVAAERLATVREWEARGVPVTYVRSPVGAALIDEREVFDRAIGG